MSRAGWLGVCLFAALGAVVCTLALPASALGALDWQPGLAIRQPWRAVTAACVHWSPLHLAANLAGTALVAALGSVAGCDRRDAAAWALAWPLTQLGLLLKPDLQHFGGLSGVLHAGVAVVCVHLLLRARGARQAVGAALSLGLLAKVLLEAPWGPALRQAPEWDIAIAPLAHATGSVAGVLCAFAVARWPDQSRPPDRMPG